MAKYSKKKLKMKIKNTHNIKHTHLIHAISKDTMRPSMTGIYFDLANQSIVATNSYILLICPIEVEIEDSDLNEGFKTREIFFKKKSKIVPLELFDQRKYMGDAKNYIHKIHYTLDDDFARVWSGNEEVFKCKYIDGNFPDYKNVIPKKESKQPLDSIGLRVDLVNSIFKMISFKSKDIHFEFYEKNKALRFKSFHDARFHGLIMPTIGS